MSSLTKNVKMLSPSDFTPKYMLKNKKCMFVLVYAPWCPHCHTIMPIWNDIAKISKESNSFITCALDGDRYSDFLKKAKNVLQVSGFPTILIFKGDKIYHYNEGRDVNSLIRKCKEICK